jgi:hypothetical protein
MKTGRTIVNAIAFLMFPASFMAAQMQMPATNAGTSKPAAASASPKTLTGVVSDAMCALTTWLRTRARLSAHEHA